MICSIHQPDFIPYIGFFDKYSKSDVFVLLDTAQYNKNGWRNRNKIKTANGPIWLTIPVSSKLGDKINEVKISDNNFVRKHLASIEQNYNKSKYFNLYFPKIKDIYNSINSEATLFEVNEKFLNFIFNVLDYDIKVIKASDLNIDFSKSKSELLIEICQAVGSDKYISGKGGEEYLDEDLFKENKIEVIWQSFSSPTYDQLYGEFIENLSVLDMIFNIGPGIKEFLKKS